jgi:two-component system, cell cycle response regulator
MSQLNKLSASVTLCAGERSAFAQHFARALAEGGVRVERADLRALPTDHRGACVYLVEDADALAALSKVVHRPMAPILVVAASPALAREALSKLTPWHDLALTTDDEEVVAWRLWRVVHQFLERNLRSDETDSLTGALNRHGWTAQARAAIESLAPGAVSGVLMLDLDHIKLINDRFGHMEGDRVLVAIESALQKCLAPGDLIGRLGGDEFVCLLNRYDTESIVRDSELLLARVAALDLPDLQVDGAPVRITASAGLTFVRSDVSLDMLLREADEAMYAGKAAGRNRLALHGCVPSDALRTNRDLQVHHFENVTRVATDRLVAMITQMSRRLVDAAKQEANLDALTGLHNRRHFDARLSREIEAARSRGRALSLALIDVDHFHDINMTHGWPTGDRVLQTFATVVQGHVRATDWVARYGGEEFVIVMPDTELAAAIEVTERVRRAFAEIAIDSVEGSPVTATFSAGVAQYGDATASPIDFVQQASKRLLSAKATGRNRTEPAG